ncbi:NAD-dependent epimerase/dehydratase family protein [Helicobacter pullorum]|uniref:NAD-dependent epimerase/dehydratase family protein n=1 Tax=Helicobacter pullorum TaxID=35818 RepID=UPI002432B171|nr:NAD-dependent epimerase/dehydratase family protein [Helicobacter pullorum]
MQNPKLKILLTGATGFIGTNFVLNLHKKYEIIALVRQSSDVSKIDKFCKIYRYDESIESIQKVFESEKIDGVVHLATRWLFAHNFEQIKGLVETNLEFGSYLLEFTKMNELKFFINSATFGSYCDSLSYRPANLYAATKKAFEDIMYYYALTSKTTFTNLLIYNVYGPNDTSPRIFTLLDKLSKTKEVLEMSDGSQIVDYSHVYDVVNGFDCLIELIQKDPEFCKDKIFSLKGKERKTLKEVITLYEKILGKKLNIKWGVRPKRELEIMQPWEGGETLPNWEQKISLEEGFRMLKDDF